MAETPIDKRFAVLCEIVRAQHFAWHEAVRQLCREVDTAAVTMRMWELTGEQTARAYLEHLDPDRPLALQVAESIVWSSRAMGEDAVAEAGEGEVAYVRHAGCPWHRWHERTGLLAEDQPGCDAWLRSTIEHIARKVGRPLRFETEQSLPEGGQACVRRIWVDEPGD